MVCKFCGSLIEGTRCENCGGTMHHVEVAAARTAKKRAKIKRLAPLAAGLLVLVLVAVIGIPRLIKPAAPVFEPSVPGYVLADYETYNTYAETNGLGGTHIAFEAQVESLEIMDTGVVLIAVVPEGKWLVVIGETTYVTREDVAALNLVGKTVQFYATYEGFSDMYRMPACFVFYAEDRIIDPETGWSYNFMWDGIRVAMAEEDAAAGQS